MKKKAAIQWLSAVLCLLLFLPAAVSEAEEETEVRGRLPGRWAEEEDGA